MLYRCVLSFQNKQTKKNPLLSIVTIGRPADRKAGSDIIITYQFLLEVDEGASCDLSEEDQ